MTNKATQFKKGQSGNPNGAPKKEWTWHGVLKRLAEEEQANGIELKELMGKSLVKEALKGNVAAIKEFGDRIDGKAPQALELSGRDGGPIDNNVTVRFVSTDDKDEE